MLRDFSVISIICVNFSIFDFIQSSHCTIRLYRDQIERNLFQEI